MYTIFFYNIYKMTVVEEQRAQKSRLQVGACSLLYIIYNKVRGYYSA